MDTKEQLQEAIETLYIIFERYPLRNPVPGCDCCIHPEEQECLSSKPLRQLTKENLGRYPGKALTTWGDSNDFRHFLPRILELVACDARGLINTEIIIGKLTYVGWQDWPIQEQTAIMAYFDALWRSILTDESTPVYIDSFLGAVGRVLNDLTPFLNTWTTISTPVSRLRLAEFVTFESQEILQEHRYSNAFLKDRPEPTRQIADWFLSSLPWIRQEIEEGYLLYPDESETFSWAIDALDWYTPNSSA